MSKEHLEKLIGITKNKIEYIKKQPKIDWVYLEYYEGILDLITRLESIDKSNPSEALECLERIYANVDTDADYYFVEVSDDYNIIEQSLIEFQRLDSLLRLPSEQSSSHFTYKDKNLVCMQKIKYRKLITQENVLKIIKEKNVHIQYLKGCKDVKQYNRSALLDEELLDEEFDFLKEMLK